MKVAIDSGPITSGHSVRGIGVHTSELINHLKKLKGLEIDVVDFSKSDLKNFDIVHYPSFHPHILSLPIFKKNKSIVTIHDLIRLIYPEAYPPGLKGKFNFFLQKLALKNIDAVITISETSKKDIIRFLNIPPEKIFVIYLAQDEIYKKIKDKKILNAIKKKYDLPNKFVLFVGDVNYNKNLNNLAKACKIAKIPLVMVGKQTKVENLDNHIENLSWINFLKKYKNDRNIIRLGFLDREEVVAINNLATVYCQPSLYEGFGLPCLESLACGTPVVAAKTQAIVEILGSAATYVDPYDPSSIVKGFEKLVKNPKLPRIYSWEKTALETYEVYKKVFQKK
ncbi:MAG: glycosyltransferase family 4 protein [Candidatus Woesebacteria bacterium]|nr:MAG: glycosyltransferase family 4 protein [Candidatus Woesebacteria bacterium]